MPDAVEEGAVLCAARISDTVPAVALCGGAALYLLAEVAILYRTTRRIFRRRTVGMIVLLALIPAALAIPRSRPSPA